MRQLVTAAIAILLICGARGWARQDPSTGSSQTPPATEEKSQSEPAQQTTPPATENSTQHAEENKSSQPTSDNAAKPDAGASTTANQPAAARKRRARGRKATETVSGEPRRVVIRRGGVSEPATQIIPGMTLEESDRLKQQAQDLLGAADSDLRKLASRTLNDNQRETVSQIHHYMEIAHAALNDGDIERAHTLAQKAQLLSDDLVKH